MSFMNKAMILIPLPTSAGNHQFYNAQNFSSNKAAIMIEQHNMKNYIVEKTISQLFKDSKRIKLMGENANQLIVKDATDKIINEIIKLNNQGIK